MVPAARRAPVAARRVVPAGLVAALAAAGAGCGVAGSPSGTAISTSGGTGTGLVGVPRHVAAKDSFQGSIRSGTGKYAGDTGHAHVYLSAAGKGLTRSVKITLIGLPCPHSSHCLKLSGTANGTLTPSRVHTPDVGHGAVLTGSGSIDPLGHAAIRGDVRGTGFIDRGRETLILAVSNSSGTVTLVALSPPVGGFTSP